MVEIGVLRSQCLDRRIDDPKRLIGEIAAWEQQRNAGARIKSMFTTEKPAPKWAAPIPSRPKSHSHRAEVLGRGEATLPVSSENPLPTLDRYLIQRESSGSCGVPRNLGTMKI
jgi:hypothetical protein